MPENSSRSKTFVWNALRWSVLAGLLLSSMNPQPASAQPPADSPEKALVDAILARAGAFGFSSLDLLDDKAFEERVTASFRGPCEEFHRQWIAAMGAQGTPADRRRVQQRQQELRGQLIPLFRQRYQAAIESRRFNEAWAFERSAAISGMGLIALPELANEVHRGIREALLPAFPFAVEKIQGTSAKFCSLHWPTRADEPKNTILDLKLALQKIDDLPRHQATIQRWQAELKQLRQAGTGQSVSVSWPQFPQLIASWDLTQVPKDNSLVIAVRLVEFSTAASVARDEIPQHVFEGRIAGLTARKGAAVAQQELLGQLKTLCGPGYLAVVNEKNRRAWLLVRTPVGLFTLHYWAQLQRMLPVGTGEIERTEVKMLHDLTRILIGTFVPQPAEPVNGVARLSFFARDESLLLPFPEKPSRSRLRAELVDGEGRPVAGARLTFTEPKLGRLDRYAASTGRDGAVEVLYTAPTAKEVAEGGIPEVEVSITAASGPPWNVHDRAKLRVNAQSGGMQLVRMAYPVLPAGEKFVNTIQLAFDLPPKPVDSSYRIKVSTGSKEGRVCFEGMAWLPEFETEVPHKATRLIRYRWEGDPQSLFQPVEETVTVEVPALKLKKDFKFDVGLDLELAKVEQWRPGPCYQLLLERLHVVVRDRFPHRVAPDLGKLFEDFGVKPSVEIRQIDFQPIGVYDPNDVAANRDFYSRYLGHFEAKWTKIPSLTYGVHEGALKKRTQGDWVVYRKSTYEDGTPRLEFPAVSLQSRGLFAFSAVLSGVEKIDCQPKNAPQAISLSTQDYSGQANEMFYTIGIPCAKTLIGWLSGQTEYKMLAGLLMASVDFQDAIRLKDGEGQLEAVVAAITAVIDQLVPDQIADIAKLLKEGKIDAATFQRLVRLRKTLLPLNELAWTGKTLFDTWWDGIVLLYPEEAAQIEQGRLKKGPRNSAAENAVWQNSVRCAQAMLRGTKNHYLLLLDRRGLTNYQAQVLDAAGTEVKLQPAPKDPCDLNDLGQRIAEGDRIIVIPVLNVERIVLQLQGDAGGGGWIVVTANGAQCLRYPQTAWKASFLVDATGKITRPDGQAPDWSSDSSRVPAGPAAAGSDAAVRADVLVCDPAGRPLAGARILVRPPGASLDQARWVYSNAHGWATIRLATSGIYEVVAAQKGYTSAGIRLEATAGRPNQATLTIKPRGDTIPFVPVQGSFDGDWDATYYNNVAGTGQPGKQQRIRIKVQGATAVGFEKVGDNWLPFCSGPLSENGRVWNAKRQVKNLTVQHFDNVRLSADGRRFQGTWSGAEPHDFAWIGARAAGGDEQPVQPPVGSPADNPPPGGEQSPSRVSVELSNRNRQAEVTVAPGAEITVKVATYAGTGYRVVLVPPPATLATLVGGPRDEPMQRAATTKVLVGSGTWKVYDFQVAPGATGSGSIKFRMIGPGRQSSETQYSVTLQVSTPTRSGGTP